MSSEIAKKWADKYIEACDCTGSHNVKVSNYIAEAIYESQPEVAEHANELVSKCWDTFCQLHNGDYPNNAECAATALVEIATFISVFLTAHDAAKDAEIERLREALEEITDKAESADPVWAIAYCALHEKELDEYMAEKGGPDATD